MDAVFENRVRERAYEIWKASGMEGAADVHWLSAEQSVMNESGLPKSAATPAKAKIVKAKVVKSAASKADAAVRKSSKPDAKTRAAAVLA